MLGEFNGASRFVVAVEGKGPRDPLDRPFAGRRMSPQLRRRERQGGDSHGRRVVDRQLNQPGASGRRCQEQRNYRNPEIAGILELSGCLVTIDAMGCQTEIAAAIVAGGADYVLAVKDNQPTLCNGIIGESRISCIGNSN